MNGLETRVVANLAVALLKVKVRDNLALSQPHSIATSFAVGNSPSFWR